jgi:hypothetical protein
VWNWSSANPNESDAANAAVELPGTGQIAVVGWRSVGSVGKRCITLLDLTSGEEATTLADFGDSAGSHGAFEMAEVVGDALVVAGLHKKPSLDEMAFKSYGNVFEGKAIVQSLPLSTLTSGAVAWSREIASHVTAKAARSAGDGKVAVLVFAEEDMAAIAMLDSSDGSVSWGPTSYPEHGEGTDLQVRGASEASAKRRTVG